MPKWNFDGSSTDQAPGDDSEVILRPCRIFKDPFRARSDGLYNILVMCDTWTPQGEPLPTNARAKAMKSFEGKEDEEPWFGLEQEFTLFNLDQKTPLGWPEGGIPTRPQGPYYCSVGPENSFGRDITDAMYKACLYAGINISGTNGEVMPGQQEYQVGPCVGIDAGDQLMMSRYILQRVCEDFQVYCTLHPKPIVDGDWNGAGMHTNVSTKSMREEGGLDIIKSAIYKLGAKHAEHIAVYGEGNELRLTGKFETASIDQFSFGIANRGASVRIGRDTEAEGKGYFEGKKYFGRRFVYGGMQSEATKSAYNLGVTYSIVSFACCRSPAFFQCRPLPRHWKDHGNHHGTRSTGNQAQGQGCCLNLNVTTIRYQSLVKFFLKRGSAMTGIEETRNSIMYFNKSP